MRACKNCKRLVKGKECPVCHSTELSDRYMGSVIIIDPNRSLIAKALGVEVPGEYALRVK